MAGMASAAMLLAPGCGTAPKSNSSADEPVRRANFRSLVARDFLLSCAGASARGETRTAMARHEELKQLGVGAEAGHALALGENDWAGLKRHERRARLRRGGGALSRRARRLRRAASTRWRRGSRTMEACDEAAFPIALLALAAGCTTPGTGWSRAPDLSVYGAMDQYGAIAREHSVLCGGFSTAAVGEAWREDFGAREAAVTARLVERHGAGDVAAAVASRSAARPLRRACRP